MPVRSSSPSMSTVRAASLEECLGGKREAGGGRRQHCSLSGPASHIQTRTRLSDGTLCSLEGGRELHTPNGQFCSKPGGV